MIIYLNQAKQSNQNSKQVALPAAISNNAVN